ncbi:MAG TPA: class E sortase [Candidatus Lumbricidophila sp.]|nr:class E sortase [Candidatus Lumbricidophila sp.]
MSRRASHRRPVARRRVSVVGVLGELMLTAGVLVGLFLVWQLGWNNVVFGADQGAAAAEQSDTWVKAAKSTPKAAAVTPDAPLVDATNYPNGQSFAVTFIPRFDETYPRAVAQGTGLDVLNSRKSGIGHYPNTQMPGEIGNFAIAAHRNIKGANWVTIQTLQVGDPIYVQTKDGWYTYRFRNFEYVHPTGVDVLKPVPQRPDIVAKDRIITLTTCNPLNDYRERIIAYGTFESWRPLAEGVPPEIADAVAKWSK